jgi:hypothetical protein
MQTLLQQYRGGDRSASLMTTLSHARSRWKQILQYVTVCAGVWWLLMKARHSEWEVAFERKSGRVAEHADKHTVRDWFRAAHKVSRLLTRQQQQQHREP